MNGNNNKPQCENASSRLCQTSSFFPRIHCTFLRILRILASWMDGVSSLWFFFYLLIRYLICRMNHRRIQDAGRPETIYLFASHVWGCGVLFIESQSSRIAVDHLVYLSLEVVLFVWAFFEGPRTWFNCLRVTCDKVKYIYFDSQQFIFTGKPQEESRYRDQKIEGVHDSRWVTFFSWSLHPQATSSSLVIHRQLFAVRKTRFVFCFSFSHSHSL